MASVPIQPWMRDGSSCDVKAMMRKPASGASSTIQAEVVTSAL